MNIQHGLLAGQVLQRNRRGLGSALVTGTCAGSDAVEVRVGARWRRCGAARAGKWRANLPPLRVGGPYRVEFRIGTERLVVPEIFVGDVWFMAGQSNMGGGGNLDAAPAAHPKVRAFYLRDEWAIARDPLHFLPEAVDAAYTDQNKRVGPEELRRYLKQEHKGAGLGVWFGREMYRRTGVPQAVVPNALGGSGLEHWSPKLKHLGGAALYGAMLRRYRKLGQPIAGILWNQGSTDAHEDAVPLYPARMRELVAAVRRDFGLPKLPWLVTQIARFVLPANRSIPCWNKIQEAQRRLPETIPHLAVVGSADCELDDFVHTSSAGHQRNALRLARLADRSVLGNRREPLAPAPRSAEYGTYTTPAGRTYRAVKVEFDNVVGGLHAAGVPTGFCLVDPHGRKLDDFYQTRLDGRRVILEIESNFDQWPAFGLQYGHGTNPYVNITDSRDMPIPVFGPYPLKRISGAKFITAWQVAPVEGDALQLEYTPALRERAWRPVPVDPVISAPELVMPDLPAAPRSGSYLFQTQIHAARAVDARLILGADSPLQIWCNGTRVFRDAKLTNPAVADQCFADVTLRPGANEILVAFDSRGGNGWGFMLRVGPRSGGKSWPAGTIKLPR